MAVNNLSEWWIELIQDPGTSSFVLNEFLESAESLRIWDGAKDENLKSFLSIINRLLNETKTTSKGLMLLDHFVRFAPPSRLIGVQDVLTSAIHLTVKNLDAELAQEILCNFLPHCQKLPELNQVLTTTIVSKILSHFGEQSKDSSGLSIKGLNLLRVCLQKYHGPCGNFRTNLEKILLPAIDQNFKGSTTRLMLRTLPLLSGAGGGGTKGDKHGQDWQQMVTKVLRATHDCVAQLFGDACAVSESQQSQNPFNLAEDSTPLNIPDIREKDVYNRLALLKRRLLNLTSLLGFYLRDSFPVVKSVPQRGVVSVISMMLLLNPVDILKNLGGSARQEFVYLASILPSVHQAAFSLLKSLMSSVGENLITEAVRVEQLFLKELIWIFEKTKWLDELKGELYKTMLSWLKLTNGSVTNSKTVTGWIGFLKKDVEIVREVVELNLTSKSKKKGSRVTSTHTISTSTRAGDIVVKNSKVTKLALDLLTLLHTTADPATHQALYKQVGKIVAEFTQSAKAPSPYDDPHCRIAAFNFLLSLAMNPHVKSPVSLSLIISLVQQGRNDPLPSVTTYCHHVTSLLERLAHPICPTMHFPSLSLAPATTEITEEVSNSDKMDVDKETPTVPVETTESFCQTDVENETDASSHYTSAFETTLNATRNNSSILDMDEIKETIVQTIQKNMRLMSRQNFHVNGGLKESDEDDDGSIVEKLGSPIQSHTRTTSLNSPFPSNGFPGKRKPEAENEILSSPETHSTPCKKPRSGEGESEFVEWLKDFVNVGPDDN